MFWPIRGLSALFITRSTLIPKRSLRWFSSEMYPKSPGTSSNVTSQPALELCNGFGKLPSFEKLASAVEREVCALPTDGYATEICGLLAFGSGTCGIALLAENRSECDVRAGLVWEKSNGAAQSCGCFFGCIILFIDIPEEGPGVAVVRTPIRRAA